MDEGASGRPFVFIGTHTAHFSNALSVSERRDRSMRWRKDTEAVMMFVSIDVYIYAGACSEARIKRILVTVPRGGGGESRAMAMDRGIFSFISRHCLAASSDWQALFTLGPVG